MGAIKETQNENLQTENFKSTGRLMEAISNGVEHKFADLKNFFTPLQEKARDLKKKVSRIDLPPITPKAGEKQKSNTS